MGYQSLYRRYRPQRFAEVVGQDPVTRTLRNAVREGRVAHAYLFSGPRGTGKTSTARIVAKVLNCAAPRDGEPCGECDSCVQVAAGTSLDVMELDAASNNGVDAMRDLISRAALGTAGRAKVYIVDEVHMLSAGASNALLKTLEEPPSHVYFVLATTDPQKVLPTIRSRTQHFEFRLLAPDVLLEHLRWVVADAGLEVAPEAIELVARRGSGSARDALSALDQVVAAGGGIEDETMPVDDLVEALCERDAGRVLVATADATGRGLDPRQLARGLIERLREVFLALMARQLVALPDDDLARVEDQARRLGAAASVRAIEVLGEALVDMRESVDPRITLETALVRIARPDADTSPAALLERVERLERRLAGHVVAPSVEAAHEAVAPRDAVVARDADPGGAEPADGTGGPAAAGRAALGAYRTAPRAPAAPAAPRAGTRRGPAAPASAPVSQPTSPPDVPVPAADGSAPADAAGLPTRDELVLAWGDGVLPGLTSRAKPRWAGGRWLGVDGGAAVYGVPNEPTLARCEEFRGEVEAALAAHFGRSVPVRLVVDSGSAPTSEGAAADARAAEPDDEVDLADLRDAPASAVPSGYDQLLQAFPGATPVEE